MNFDDAKKGLFHNGRMFDAYEYMGCQYDDKTRTATFRVWAPRAERVSVVGDFNDWKTDSDPMERVSLGGVWEAVVTGVGPMQGYKFYIENGVTDPLYKSDPYAFHSETHDSTASKVYAVGRFCWHDEAYLAARNARNPYCSPMNVYEAHLGSWRKYADGNYFDYRKFADEISVYLVDMGFTHLELMGIAEYPFDGSWGYQVTGYFAPTSRYGTPDDFVYLVDTLHRNNIGLILDWVPGHFPKNGNGLYEFDGFPLYEPEDELRKEHKEWGTRCFDYAKGEVRSFLISNAMMWLDLYHVDGLRVDAVASMLYLDYGRQEWRPNWLGGKENLDAVEFFRTLNAAVFERFPKALMIAEESTAWPSVTKPVDVGGLGFNFKWNMGWMNDGLDYVKTDPLFRAGKHNNLTFSMTYAFSENYILPISHDEVVHGKGSLVNKMPGDYEMKFAGWRNYLMNMFGHPGKKLLFMGTEFAQFAEWNFAAELDWQLLGYPAHKGAQDFMRELCRVYRTTPALYEIEDDWAGYEWLVADDYRQNVLVYERRDKQGNRLLVVVNFSPVAYPGYRFGADAGTFTEILRSDLTGWNLGGAVRRTSKVPSHAKKTSLALDIPPLAGIYMVCPAKKKSASKSGKDADKKPSAKSGKAPAKTSAKKSEKSDKAPAKKQSAPAASKSAGPKVPADEKPPRAAKKPK